MNTSLSEPSDPGSSRSKGTDKSSDRGQSISETSLAPVLDIVRLMDVVLDVASFPSPCGSNPLLTNLWINQYGHLNTKSTSDPMPISHSLPLRNFSRYFSCSFLGSRSATASFPASVSAPGSNFSSESSFSSRISLSGTACIGLSFSSRISFSLQFYRNIPHSRKNRLLFAMYSFYFIERCFLTRN